MAISITKPSVGTTTGWGDVLNTALDTIVAGVNALPAALVPTAVKTANYTAVVGDLIPVDTTSGPVTVTLPTAPADKAQVAVKHVVQGSANAVTIARGGTDVFNKTGGSTSLSLTTANQLIALQYQASTGIWYVLNDSLALSALNGTFAPVAEVRSVAAGHLATFTSRLAKGQGNLVVSVLGDSTGVGTTRWVYLVAQWLATQYPAYTVNYRPWNDTTPGYDATVVVQTGTGIGNAGGPFLIDVYNASASGRAASYMQTNLAAMVPVTPDLMFVNDGHNESNTVATMMAAYDLLVRQCRATWPKCDVVLMTQNPDGTGSANSTPAQALAKNQGIVEYAAAEGYGLIDITQTWLDYSATWDADLNNADHIHPSDAKGSPLWASEVEAVLTRNRKAQPIRVRPTQNHLWVPAAQFGPILDASALAETAPTYETTYTVTKDFGPTWAFDPASSETVAAWVDVPAWWNTWNFYLFFTCLANVGGNAGNVIWQVNTATIPTTFPAALGASTQLGGGVRTVAVGSGDVALVNRASWLASNGGYNAKGHHALRVNRFANNAGDTLGIKANFLGVRYERVD